MNFISTRNSSKSAEDLMFNMNKFIHRKKMGDYIRFNPSFKQHIGDRGIGYAPGNKEVFIAVGEQHAWKMSKSSNMKASTLTNLLDRTYGKKTNRYNLEYVKTNEKGEIFRIVPQEPVEEARKEMTNEQKADFVRRTQQARGLNIYSDGQKDTTVSINTSNVNV